VHATVIRRDEKLVANDPGLIDHMITKVAGKEPP
jgi:hypothetical protein